MLIYIAIIATISYITICFCTALSIFVSKKKLRRYAEDRREEIVAKSKEAKDAHLMDEGFDNIMRYSVNGSTGFERYDDD